MVADGMGGRAAGEAAAHLAVEALAEFLATHIHPWDESGPFPFDTRYANNVNRLRAGVKAANQRIREESARDPSRHRMAATLAAMTFDGAQITVAHVGDVRAYRLRQNTLARLTRDHSVLEEVRAARPHMTPEEVAAIAPRNVVTRALGTRETVEPTVYVNAYAPGDIYLLCSDGVWGTVPEARILEVVTSTNDLEQACQLLIDAGNEAGGPDNLTAVLIRVGS
jgi:protein phosphatase